MKDEERKARERGCLKRPESIWFDKRNERRGREGWKQVQRGRKEKKERIEKKRNRELRLFCTKLIGTGRIVQPGEKEGWQEEKNRTMLMADKT